MRVRRHRRLQKSYRHTHAAHYSFSLLAAMQFASPTTPLPPIHTLHMPEVDEQSNLATVRARAPNGFDYDLFHAAELY